MIYTHTTPTLTLTFPEEVDLSTGTDHVLTISKPVSETVIMEITDLTINGNVVEVFLTQEQTAQMKGNVVLQLNWLYNDGTKVRRACSVKRTIAWESNLHKEIME